MYICVTLKIYILYDSTTTKSGFYIVLNIRIKITSLFVIHILYFIANNFNFLNVCSIINIPYTFVCY